MITPVESFILTCDICQDHYENYSDYGIFADSDAMLQDAKDDHWHEQDGKHYCDKCAIFDEEVGLKFDMSRFKPDDEEDKTPSLEQAYPLIDKFISMYGIGVMHIEMWLAERHDIVTRSRKEDDELFNENTDDLIIT